MQVISTQIQLLSICTRKDWNIQNSYIAAIQIIVSFAQISAKNGLIHVLDYYRLSKRQVNLLTERHNFQQQPNCVL